MNEELKKSLESFYSSLKIIETLLEGEAPFKVDKISNTDEGVVFGSVKLSDEEFWVTVGKRQTQIWIINFPEDNTSSTGLPSGFCGFPTDVAGAIRDYYKSKPKSAFEYLPNIGNVGLNEVIKEELQKVFESNESVEAAASSALSFMQDIKGSIDKLEVQRGLESTNSVVDDHISEAISSLNGAIKIYFDKLEPEARDIVSSRIGEIEL